MFKSILAHPLTKGLEIDDPHTTELRRRIIHEKEFLRRIYVEWYRAIASAIPTGEGDVLELGSGAGFLQNFIPGLITSEVFKCSNASIVLDGCFLPFSNGVLKAIVMTDVFHHISQPREFLKEATRCVGEGGVLVMIEPWVTPWSQWVYQKLHHEPFRPHAKVWEFSRSGPLSGANGALPWIIFKRDRSLFEQEFPGWKIQMIKLGMPFRYLVSGGVSLRSLMPGWAFVFWHTLEKALRPWMQNLAMFAQIVLQRKGQLK